MGAPHKALLRRVVTRRDVKAFATQCIREEVILARRARNAFRQRRRRSIRPTSPLMELDGRGRPVAVAPPSHPSSPSPDGEHLKGFWLAEERGD